MPVIDGVRNTAEIAGAAAKTRANTALFQGHLDRAQTQASNDRTVNAAAFQETARAARKAQDARSSHNAAPANTSKKVGSSKAAAQHNRHPSSTQSASLEQETDCVDQGTADTASSTPLPVLDVPSLSVLPITDKTGGVPISPSVVTAPGKSDAKGQAPDVSDAVAAEHSPKPVANDEQEATPNTATSDAQAATASQAQASPPSKDFTFVKSVQGSVSNANPAKSSSDANEAVQDQPATAATQPIKVVVQPKAAAVLLPATDSNAIVAQQDAAAEPDAPPPAQIASSALPAQNAPLASSANADPEISSEQAASAIAGFSGSAETGHKHEFGEGSADKDELLESGFTATPTAEPATAAANGNSATFASLVAANGTIAVANVKAPETAAAPSPQVPPPPVEQMVFGISRLSSGANSFSMQLAPERLGSVSVQLEVDAKGKTRATFSADRPETLALMRQDSHQLVKALQDAGVKADASSLTFSLKDQGSAANQERRTPSGNTAPPRLGMGSAFNTVSNSADTPPATASSRLYDLQA